MNRGWVYRERVSQSVVGQTVLQYYSQRYRHSSPEAWQERIISGQILLDGEVADADTCLQSGQLLEYHRPPWIEPDVPLSFSVVYEDADLLIINKPSGLPVMPGGGFLEHTLLWLLQEQYPGNTPIPIHRLGRGTSGLLLLGKSKLARSQLSKQIRTNSLADITPQIKKIYWALVTGNSIADNFCIGSPIGKIPHPTLGYIYGATTNGKFARSIVKVLKREDNCSLVEVNILTGRPHQIRIHLAAAGYPLVGDPLYDVGGIPQVIPNADQLPVPGDCGYFLHAYQLSLIHPRTQQVLSLQCPLPSNWVGVNG